MDQKINAYLDSLVLEVLNSPNFVNLPQDQKTAASEKVNNVLNKVIITAIIDRLTPQQLEVIKSLDPNSAEMEQKIEEYSSQIPGLMDVLEQDLNKTVSDLKQNPQILG